MNTPTTSATSTTSTATHATSLTGTTPTGITPTTARRSPLRDHLTMLRRHLLHARRYPP